MKTIQQSYPSLAQALGVPEVYLKREDQHKYGSHKGRSIPPMIKKYLKEDGLTNFVLSSSGNVALAAIQAIQAHNRNNPTKLKLTIFVGMHINPYKLKILINTIEDANIRLAQVERPKQTAFQMDKTGQAKLIRQATDDLALIGYEELAQELSKIPNLQAIFIPTSSGTTAQGIGEAFQKLKKSVQIHVVQTTSCHRIAEEFDTAENDEQSVADALIDQTGQRKDKVIKIIKETSGSGWIITNQHIKEAINLVKDTCNVAVSTNGSLSIAGLKKAVEKGWQFKGAIVCLVTGI